MHRILQCNVRHGLQAVLELELPIVAILTDGVITMCGERAYEEWYKRYTELSTKISKRWNKVEWDKLGYELQYIPHGQFGSWYPVKKEKQESERSN